MLLAVLGPVRKAQGQPGSVDACGAGATLGLAGPHVARRPGLALPALPMTAHHRLARLVMASLACGTVLLVTPSPGGADPTAGITVMLPATPAYPADAPDPDVVHSGSTYFSFSTGTRLASYLQVLCNSDGLAGRRMGSMPRIPLRGLGTPVTTDMAGARDPERPWRLRLGRPLDPVLHRSPGRPPGGYRRQLSLGRHQP
jgi:hypothetical protein